MGRKHLYPPSVRHGIPHLGRLPRGWTKTTFGEQLRVVERPVALKDNKTYQLISAKRNRGGIVAREMLRGDQILTAGQYEVEAGDFITSNRQIIHGACGIVPRELAGAVVSGEYTVMHARRGLHLPFFAHYTHGDYFQKSCFFASVGVDVEKMIFDVEQWLKLPFYLPPKPEQHRIAAILESANNALDITRASLAQHRRVRDSAVLAQTRAIRSPRGTLGNYIVSIDAGRSPSCEDRPAEPGEVGVLKISAVSLDGFRANENKVVQDTSVFTAHMQIKNGDFLITRANTAELVGLTCVVELLPNELLYLSDKTLRLNLDTARMDTGFLDALLKTPLIRAQLISAATGTSGSMKNIGQDEVRSLRLPIPSLAEQKKISRLVAETRTAIAVEERYLATLQRVKSELARQLLTGELRVKV